MYLFNLPTQYSTAKTDSAQTVTVVAICSDGRGMEGDAGTPGAFNPSGDAGTPGASRFFGDAGTPGASRSSGDAATSKSSVNTENGDDRNVGSGMEDNHVDNDNNSNKNNNKNKNKNGDNNKNNGDNYKNSGNNNNNQNNSDKNNNNNAALIAQSHRGGVKRKETADTLDHKQMSKRRQEEIVPLAKMIQNAYKILDGGED